MMGSDSRYIFPRLMDKMTSGNEFEEIRKPVTWLRLQLGEKTASALIFG
jgi:hypothetical protein